MQQGSFELNGVNYKLNKMNAFKQFHIVRKVAPILGKLLPVINSIKKIDDDKLQDEEKWDQIAKLATPILEGLSKLSEEDADKVLKALLATVEKQNHGAWSFVVVGESLMFADMDLPTMMQLAGRAFMFNLADFFTVLPRLQQ